MVGGMRIKDQASEEVLKKFFRFLMATKEWNFKVMTV